MRHSSIKVLALALAAMIFVSEAPGERREPIAWGKSSRGLRIGVSVVHQPSNAKMIKILLQNTSAAPEELVVGVSCGRSIGYLPHFILTGSDHPYTLVDRGDGPCAGVALPIRVRLAPGALYSIERPTNLLVVDKGRSDVPLSSFFRRGYFLSVSFEEKIEYFTVQMGVTGPPPYAWTGRCISGELPLRRQQF